jgi:hypothetical protein
MDLKQKRVGIRWKEEGSMNQMMIGAVGLLFFAASPVCASSSTNLSGSQPEVKTYNGIPYVSGGFGLEERAELRTLGKADNLELSFALQNKDYLGGADVLIKDSNGKEVLEAVSDGPLFFTKLPAGKYSIEATAEGRTAEQVVQVPAKGQTRIYFAWKESTTAAPQTQAMANP